MTPVGAPFHGAQNGIQVLLCPTTHNAIHACLRVHLAARAKGRPPTAVELRPFTKFTRALAQTAMDALGPQAEINL